MANADPTIAELDTQFASDCALLEKLRLALITQTNDYVGLLNISQTNLEGDFTGSRAGAQQNHRSGIVTASISDTAALSLLSPAMRNYGVSDEVESSSRQPKLIFDDLYDFMQGVAVAAQGTLTIDTDPADGDTMVVGSTTYRFKTTIAQAEDILRGDGVPAVKARIVAVLNGTASLTDLFVGSTTPHPTVRAGAFAGDDSIFTARDKGTAGDALTTTETFTAGTNVFDATTLGAVTAGVAPRTVQSRVFTFGAIAAASANNGNGTIKRFTVNSDGHEIESGWPDVTTIECTSSGFGNNGAQRAKFKITGRSAGIDRATENGAAAFGANVTLRTNFSELTARNTTGISNADFNNLTGATDADGVALTAMGSWELVTGTIGNQKMSLGTAGTNYYRDLPGRSIVRALDVTETFKIRQRYNRQPDLTRPFYRALIFKTENSAAGQLRLRVGSQRAVVDVSTVTGFGILELNLDRFAWAKEWQEYDSNVLGIPVEIDWERTAGNLLFCEVLIAPADMHDGLGYVGVPAATGTTVHTPFQSGSDSTDADNFSFTNTEVGAIVQTWGGHRAFRKFLPHAPSSPTIGEPTVT